MINKLKAVFDKEFSFPIQCLKFFKTSGNNDYSLLKTYIEKKGVYRFFMYQNEENVTLYIGQSHTATHGLKKRVKQNLTALDTGGTFRDNLAIIKFDGDINKSIEFIKQNAYVQFIVVEDDYEESQIKMLEQIAISLFEPLYNK
ncbi:hypothetical protein [Lentibacillus sp. Marseille-P4043]|uniref:hypothetical protein n=1 Tax=Lentibacillus sp. Marseille-P4043 TaxID=2040293 RepID=UPI000D0BB5A9|nr:hypothetical protein [Lentibacillus sp. Marseille-P4043]